MPIPVAPNTLEVLATPQRVGKLLAQTVADLDDIDADSLQQACTDADAIVWDYLMRSDVGDLAPEVVEAVLFVATKVAARIYRNPREIASYSANEVNTSYQDPRILTSDERAQLRRARSARVVRGPIKIGGSAL